MSTMLHTIFIIDVLSTLWASSVTIDHIIVHFELLLLFFLLHWNEMTLGEFGHISYVNQKK